MSLTKLKDRCVIQLAESLLEETVDNILVHCNDVINTVKKRTDRVVLFYSCGKDSIAMLDLIAPHFKEVICVFMYFVKDLEHIEKYIRYSKARYKNATFMQIPHWNLSWIYREGFYCVPQKIKTKTLKDVISEIKEQTGCNYCFLGMKQADSLNRRLMLRGYEKQAINEKTGMVYPLSKWSNKDVENYINIKQLPKPVKYSNKKVSQGLGFDIEVFLFLRKNYPDDLKKIIDKFPLSESILFEHDQKQRTENGTTKIQAV